MVYPNLPTSGIVSVADHLPLFTAPIHTVVGNEIGCGTGFFVSALYRGTKQAWLITNKHVLKDATEIHVTLHTGEVGKVGTTTPHTLKQPRTGVTEVPHPDPTVDLTALQVEAFLEMGSVGVNFVIQYFSDELIATSEDLNDLSVCDEVALIGYPEGLSDHVHNLPLVRRGVLASLPFIDFQGRKEFVIDASCFPGSSGSPVVLFRTNAAPDKRGKIRIGQPVIKLLGVLWGGPTSRAEGTVQPAPIPTLAGGQVSTKVMMNLGFCLKASRVAELIAAIGAA